LWFSHPPASHRRKVVGRPRRLAIRQGGAKLTTRQIRRHRLGVEAFHPSTAAAICRCGTFFLEALVPHHSSWPARPNAPKIVPASLLDDCGPWARKPNLLSAAVAPLRRARRASTRGRSAFRASHTRSRLANATNTRPSRQATTIEPPGSRALLTGLGFL